MTVEAGVAWSLVTLFVLVLIAGLALGVRSLVRGDRSSRGRATGILAERLARGEIDSEEYRERLSVLESATPAGHRRTGLLAVALIATGAIGTVAAGAWAASTSWDWMRAMMRGDMMPMMQSGPTERVAPAPQDEARTITVAGGEFFFNPGELRLRSGETVNIEFDNEGHMFHTLTVAGLGLDLRARSGDAVAGALTPEQPGVYELVCTVPQHAELGMRGEIVVAAD